MPKVLRTIVIAIMMAGATVSLATTATAGRCEGTPTPPTVGQGENALFGVDAVSRCNAWAVGEYLDKDTGKLNSLILHWNGTAWKRQRTPAVGAESSLSAVAATSSVNAWAVGDFKPHGGSVYRSFVLHWNGTKWKRQSIPEPGSGGLDEVAATSSSNAWAVGSYYSDDVYSYRTFLLHWNGTKWKRQKSPNQGTGHNYLTGVTATSSTNAWAVGRYGEGEWCGGFYPYGCNSLILRWNGTAWKRQQSPTGMIDPHLEGVAATSSANAWAVGTAWSETNEDYETLLLRWSGAAWTVHNLGSLGVKYLTGVTATSSTNTWAVGYSPSDSSEEGTSLVLRWNGATWGGQAIPHVGTGENALRDVSATSATNAWAVGTYTAAGECSLTGDCHSLILRWNGTAWSE